MKRILRRQTSGYVLALILCLIGLTAILVTLWKAWLEVSSAQVSVSTLWELLWTQRLGFILGMEFKLGYFLILGAVSIVVGVVILILSRQWFSLPGETVLYQCPFCKKRWRALRDKALVHCPHCRQLVHPTMVER
jgi:hypothetical protein